MLIRCLVEYVNIIILSIQCLIPNCESYVNIMYVILLFYVGFTESTSVLMIVLIVAFVSSLLLALCYAIVIFIHVFR